jgi:hypothetical protein
MTPEERLQEQEQLAYEAELESKKGGGDSEIDLGDDDDEVKSFDVKQAEMELRRATLSAVTCPDVVEKAPKGAGEVTVNFRSDGAVRDASLNQPFSGSAIEDCVLNAYRAVIVPPFKEAEYSMNWKVDLSGKKADLMPKEKDEVAEALANKDKKTDEKDEKGKDGKDGDKKKK